MQLKAGAINEYRFPTGSLVASAGGIINVTSNVSLNGTIQKITMETSTYTGTGSLQFFASGTPADLILGFTSGTIFGNVGGGFIVYPMAYPQGTNGVTGSPQAFVRPTINGPIQIIGSGLGNGTSGLSIVVQWI